MCDRPLRAITNPGSPSKRAPANRSGLLDFARRCRLRTRRRPAECVATGNYQLRRSAERQSAGRHSDGPAGCGSRHPQQAQRHRPKRLAPSRAIGAVEGRRGALAGVRNDRPVGAREIDRRVRPGRRAAARQGLGPSVFRLALQGIAVAQRGGKLHLRRVAQKLRDDVSGRSASAGGAGDFEQPVQCQEIRWSARTPIERFGR